ncbi:MAG: glycoside hydrolase family 1 protein [Deltaproteobacteria bacterium]|nr:glycoside hydrolase family 1 protein [Deltaproteobacteria bacterium]
MSRPLPPDFLLGCATSAYQVEGGIENDWSEWAEAGRLKDPSTRCGAAADHWRRYPDDFQLLKALGADSYRFSIEWARVEPEPGRFDPAALAGYGARVRALRDLGVEPVVTLLHFTHPRWFHQTTPWHAGGGRAAGRFVAFVERVLEALDGQARMFTVLNEPGVWLAAAYLAGVIPPGEQSLGHLVEAGAELIRAHAGAARLIRQQIPGAQVGVAHHVLELAPARPWNPVDRAIAAYGARAFNHAVPTALTTGVWQLGLLPGIRRRVEIPEAAGSLDFLGVNYYTRAFVQPGLLPRPGMELFYEDRGGRGVTDLGWELHPHGLTTALEQMARYHLPMYVTENGLDDRDDSRRAAYLFDHLGAVLDAVDAGVDVRGYFHWSLMDNFEWLEGFGPRFGLYSVDYATQARTPTRAAALFQEIARGRALPAERPEERRRPGLGRVKVG